MSLGKNLIKLGVFSLGAVAVKMLIKSKCPAKKAKNVETVERSRCQQNTSSPLINDENSGCTSCLEVVEQVLSYMKNRLPDTICDMDAEGRCRIKSPPNGNGNRICIYIDNGDDELILEFAGCHTHYDLEDEAIMAFYDQLNDLLLGKACVACSYYMDDGEEWLESTKLLFKECWHKNLEELLTEREMYYEFGANRKVVCSLWDAARDRIILTRPDMSDETWDFRRDFLDCEEYLACVLDYTIFKCDGADYRPAPASSYHRDAVLHAIENACSPGDWAFNIDEAHAEEIDAEKFLSVPNEPWKYASEDGEHFIDEVVGDKLQYWFAFLEPPLGDGPELHNPIHGELVEQRLGVEDFHKVNAYLFPNGPGSLTVMEWSTDWSEYFDDGRKGWGAACWSIYDHSLDRYVVIMVSIEKSPWS